MKIQVVKSYKESFRDLWVHKLDWGRVAFSSLAIWLLSLLGGSLVYAVLCISRDLGFCKLTNGPILLGLVNAFYCIVSTLAYLSLYINGYRYAVLKEGGNRWWNLQLSMRSLRMVWCFILLVLLTFFLMAIIGGVIWLAGTLFLISIGRGFATGDFNTILNNLFSAHGSIILNTALFIGGVWLLLYYFIRVNLSFLLVSIDQANPISTSWHLMKGNTWRMIALLLLILMSICLVSLAIIGIIILFIPLSVLNAPGLTDILAGFLVFIELFFFWALFSKAHALVYHDLMSNQAEG